MYIYVHNIIITTTHRVFGGCSSFNILQQLKTHHNTFDVPVSHPNLTHPDTFICLCALRSRLLKPSFEVSFLHKLGVSSCSQCSPMSECYSEEGKKWKKTVALFKDLQGMLPKASPISSNFLARRTSHHRWQEFPPVPSSPLATINLPTSGWIGSIAPNWPRLSTFSRRSGRVGWRLTLSYYR